MGALPNRPHRDVALPNTGLRLLARNALSTPNGDSVGLSMISNLSLLLDRASSGEPSGGLDHAHHHLHPHQRPDAIGGTTAATAASICAVSPDARRAERTKVRPCLKFRAVVMSTFAASNSAFAAKSTSA